MKFSYQDSLDEALQKNLYESATRDPLTGVHNKKYFAEALEKEFKFSSRHDNALSLLMIDVDHFKRVNDMHGHLVGDNVLSQLATLLAGTIRSEDLFARWGGEEFIVLLRRCPRANAVEVAERMRQLVAGMTFRACDPALRATISIGVASYSRGLHSDFEALVRAADDQLYRAKNAGRNRVECEPAEGVK
jgi:diguanylate cyclase (GGDEF)-like protein